MVSSNAEQKSFSRKRKAGEQDLIVATTSIGSHSTRAIRPAPFSNALRRQTTSILRLHVRARERLTAWKPTSSRDALDSEGRSTNLVVADLSRIKELISGSYELSTLESYGSGLLIYHVFCDEKQIAETQRAPASPVLMASFVATIAGAYSGSTIRNYFYSVRAWHLVHGVVWNMNDAEMEALLRGAVKAAPASSKRKQRVPYTPDFMIAVRGQLDLTKPLDTAVYACLTTTFYAAARLGEFVVPTLKTFNPALHVKPSDVRTGKRMHGKGLQPVLIIFCTQTWTVMASGQPSSTFLGQKHLYMAKMCHGRSRMD